MRVAVIEVADKRSMCGIQDISICVFVCVHSRVLQTLRTAPPISKDELHSPPGNGAEKWRRDGQNGMGGQ